MTTPTPPSDEPARLAGTIRPLFSLQSGWSFLLGDHPAVTVIAGVDAQDDCAVLRVHEPLDLVVGSDYVRGAKFYLYERGLLDEFDLGVYLAAANFSDVAAMGALPAALLSVVRYPPDMTDDRFNAVMRGIAAGCSANNALNVGGDIGTAERLILSGSALGIVPRGRSLLRSGAQHGDLVCTTGPTGMAGSALAYFRSVDNNDRSLSQQERDALLRPWRRARAKTVEGRILSASGRVTACIDTSDGLKGALHGIAHASHVGVEIDANVLPVAPLVRRVAEVLGLSVLDLVLGDSVDFELAFTVGASDLQGVRHQFEGAGIGFHVVGKVTSEHEGLTLRLGDGTIQPLPGLPWRNA